MKVPCLYHLEKSGKFSEFCGAAGRSCLKAIKTDYPGKKRGGGTNGTPTSVRACNDFGCARSHVFECSMRVLYRYERVT
jgi:hypothetical protein